jgi:hypothetical protein
MKKVFLAAVFTVMTSLAHAGTQVGTIEYVRVRTSDGLVYFALNGPAKVGSPACAALGYWIIRDESSNAGKQQYAMLLAAQLAGRTISVAGSNTCARWADGEDVAELRLGD